MHRKSRIFFIVSSNEYIRNYIQTNVLNLIEKEYEVIYVFNKDVIKNDEINKKSTFVEYKYDVKQSKKLSNLFDIYMYLNINKSTSFLFRYNRYKLSKKSSFIKTLYYFLINFLKFNFSFFQYYFKADLIRIRSNRFVFPYYISNILKNINLNEQLYKAFDEFKPDLVLFPSSAYEPISYDLVELARKFNCKTFFLIDNWDNLSSKTILFNKPDYLGVWSEQCRQHAISIQDFDSEKIKIIGSARFHNYFLLKNQKLNSYFDFKYILFIGTTLEFDEYEVLIELNKIFCSDPYFSEFKIIYRPHPWRQSSSVNNFSNLSKVIIDPQVKDAYSSKSNDFTFQPDLSYYPGLISNAEFLVGGLSSMLIESLIFEKKYVALVHDDNKNFTNQKNALKFYTHFKGIEKLNNLFFCEDLKFLHDTIRFKIFEERRDISKEFDSSLDYFIYGSNSVSYNEILLNSVNEIFQD